MIFILTNKSDCLISHLITLIHSKTELKKLLRRRGKISEEHKTECKCTQIQLKHTGTHKHTNIQY